MVGRRRFRKKADLRRKVQSIIRDNLETKFKSHSGTAIAVTDSTVSPTDLNLIDISQNDTQQGRQGNQVKVQSYYYNLTILPNTNSIAPALYVPRCRIIIYIPKIPTSLLGSGTPLSINSTVDQDKFTVLYDRTFIPSFQSRIVDLDIKKSFHRNGKVGMTVQWASATSTDFTKNRLMCYMVSDQTVATEYPQVHFRGKCYYKDA